MWCYACSWDVRGEFNIEFYGADSHFCHSAYVTWSHVEVWSLKCQHASHVSFVAHISWDVTYVSECSPYVVIGCLQKNILFMSAATLKQIRLKCYLPRLTGAKSSHEITWHDDTRVCRLTWRELTWREDSVSPALLFFRMPRYYRASHCIRYIYLKFLVSALSAGGLAFQP